MKFRFNLFLVLVFFAVSASAKTSEKARVDLFWDTAERGIWQMFFITDAVKHKMGDRVEIKIFCPVEKTGTGGWKLANEAGDLQEVKRLAVVEKYHPADFWNYMTGRALNPWPDGWRDAARFAGIDPEKLEKETELKSSAALEEHYAYAKAKGISALAILLNGNMYSGDWMLVPFVEAVNASLPPAKRVAFPVVAAVAQKQAKLIIVSSAPFAQEDKNLTEGLSKALQGMKVEKEVIEYDKAASNPELKDAGIDFLPAYLVKASSDTEAALKFVIDRGIVKKTNGFLVVSGNGREGVYINEPVKAKTLEVFVMSQCPYGIVAEKVLTDALDKKLVPEDVTVRLRYIATLTQGKDGAKEFSSLHGSAEWEEDVRQLLIAKNHPEKFWKYLRARNADPASSMWEKAAAEAGIDAQKLAADFESGKDLLAEDIHYGERFGMSASPTFLWEGRMVLASGVDGLKKIPGFEKLSSDSPAPKGACK